MWAQNTWDQGLALPGYLPAPPTHCFTQWGWVLTLFSNHMLDLLVGAGAAQALRTSSCRTRGSGTPEPLEAWAGGTFAVDCS